MKNICGSKFILSFALALSVCFGFWSIKPAKAIDSSVVDYYDMNSNSFVAGINSGNSLSGGDGFESGRSGITPDTARQATYWGGLSFALSAASNKTISSGFTVCFWHKTDGNEARMDISFGGVGGGVSGLGGYNSPGLSSPNGTGGMGAATTDNLYALTNQSIAQNGAWHQFCYVSSPTHTIVYYDDQLAFNASNLAFPTYGDITSVNINFPNWQGAIDDLIVFNQPLSSDEISTVYNTVNISGVAFSYCGDGLCQTANENCATCPVDCGQCASNPNAGDSSLFFFSNPYTLYNQTTGKINYIYNQDVFTSHDYIEIRQISSDWATSTLIATSTIIDTSGFFSNKANGNSFFTLTGDASTTGLVNYEVIGHLAAYWSTILGDVAATTTIPYVVAVNWQNTVIPTAADILAASSTNPFYDDQAMYNAACSAEQWATPDPQMWLTGTPMKALNFTVIGCEFKLGFLIAGNKFSTIITDSLYKTGDILKNVFPFNVYTNLNSAWKNSATATVLPELSFLTPVNGNLTAQIPTTGSSTATIVLWGKDIFTSSSTLGVANATKANQLFLAIKTIIKWALWGLFGLWAVKNGKAFVEELTNGE